MPYNIGLIGAGRIGQIHAANIVGDGRARLVYVVDAIAESATKLALQHGSSVTSVDALLSDPKVNAVVIASSTDTHADLVIRAAKAGKAIFCEKPIDLTVTRAKQCLMAVEAHKVSFLLGFNRRFDPHFTRLKAKLENNDIGVVEIVHIISRDPTPPPMSYIRSSGGLFKDMTIHDFDMARWLLGEEPVAISAQASCLVDPSIGEAGDMDSAIVTLRTASGKLCLISNSRRAAYGYDQRIEVLGSQGMLQAGNVRSTTVSCHLTGGATSDPIEYFFLERYAAAYRAEMAHFIDILDDKATPRVTIEDGLEALRIAEMATEANNSGLTVYLKKSTVGEETARLS